MSTDPLDGTTNTGRVERGLALLCDRYGPLLGRLKISECIDAMPQEANWDSRGGLRTTEPAKRTARAIADLLVETPDIRALANGGIDWRYANKEGELTITISPNGDLSGHCWWNDAPPEPTR